MTKEELGDKCSILEFQFNDATFYAMICKYWKNYAEKLENELKELKKEKDELEVERDYWKEAYRYEVDDADNDYLQEIEKALKAKRGKPA